MAKKKKGGKKKGKKKKAGDKGDAEKKNEVDAFPELNALTIAELEAMIPDLEEQLEVRQVQRNYMQLERDQVATFYEVTKKEVRELELEVTKKDREMEIMEENHKVEERVYIQKVRHLEYQHKINVNEITEAGEEASKELVRTHKSRVRKSTIHRKDVEEKTKEMRDDDESEIKVTNERHKMALNKLEEQFEKGLKESETQYKRAVEELEKNLELQRKVEIHEIEERKNTHINSLLESHEKAFKQIREYYNAITRDNVKLIKDLKNEVAAMKEKAESTQKKMVEISYENKHLKGPLKETMDEVQKLEDRLKDRAKIVLALRNAKARSRALDKEISLAEGEYVDLDTKFKRTATERDDIFGRFTETLQLVQRESELKSLVLQKRLEQSSSKVEERGEELSQIAKAANLDRFAVQTLVRKLDSVLDDKQSVINDLKFQIAKVSKAHDDVCRTMEQKLENFGISHDENFLDKSIFIGNATTTAPAGLVAK